MVRVLSLGFVLLTLPLTLGAQPIVNPDFDSNLDGWNIHHGATFWSPEDYLGSSESGSMQMVKDWPQGPLVNNTQCVLVTAGMEMGIGSAVLVPLSGPPADVYLTLSYFTDSACIDSVSFDRSHGVPVQGSWVRFESSLFTVPGGVQSAMVMLQLNEVDAIPATAHFDHVQLFFFSDSFETGDTSRWSATVP